jgi:DNA-binding transcriptional LysR family regulator
LLVFEEVMASRKLSAAAKRLGLTQSAISHALNPTESQTNGLV